MAELGSRARAVGLAVFLLPLRVYRRFVSPALRPRCRYYPSCSAYAEEAVTELGILRGTVVAAWRLLRCNPWSRGGYDPLEARRLFRPPHGHEHPPPETGAPA